MKIVAFLSVLLMGCSSFKAERVDSQTSDERAMEITDQWVQRDTEMVVSNLLAALKKHRGFKKYLNKYGGRSPRVFVGEIKNLTSEAYFPIEDINDELLNELSASGDFVLIDAAKREAILKELTYQQDGMVAKEMILRVGRQSGAELMIFGNVFMRPARRKGKTLKQYTVNIRMTDIESAEEVVRARSKLSKYSEQSGSRW